MEKWSYEDLTQYINNDVNEFMSEGLNIRQATSRVQVEYQRVIQDEPLDKLIIYMMLSKLGIEHGFLRDDIRDETLIMVKLNEQSNYSDALSPKELEAFKKDVKELLETLS